MMQTAKNAAQALLRGQGTSERLAGQLHDIRRRLAAAGRMAAMEHGIRRAEAMLVRPLRIGIMGEANCGKSSLANLLLGDAVIPIMQYANTRIPTLIRYSRKPALS